MAFHPDYANNGLLFVYYTTDNANVVARYQVSADPNVADKASGTVVLSIPDFASNHNGGMIEVGPDGFLYIGTGDGGGGGDPRNQGQDPSALLGKILRIDVDAPSGGRQYGIPPGNPFAQGGGAPEVYMLGLRTPWRFSLEPLNGDLWIGDVGQDEIEELHYVPAATQAGANLGWKMYEGERCFDGPCNPADKLMPQFQKTHAEGWCSIIGGAVYRGSCYPDLVGTYFFTDYCAHELHSATVQSGTPVFARPEVNHTNGPNQVPGFPVVPASLSADSRGELYLTTTSCCGTDLLGGIYHLEASP